MSLFERLKRTFDTPSQRWPKQALDNLVPFRVTARNRFTFIIKDKLSERPVLDPTSFWVDLYGDLLRYYGTPFLWRENAERYQRGTLDQERDLFEFIGNCTTEEMFTVIELSFKTRSSLQFLGDFKDTVAAVNLAFERERLPYRLTEPVYIEETATHPSTGETYIKSGRIEVFPQIILSEEIAIYEEAIQPALEILGRPHFKAADQEFRKGLESYRQGKYPECLTHCGSSLESVLKVICSRKGLPYTENDTASRLIETVVPGLKMEGFFTQPWTLLATLRNRLSSSHGGGAQPRDPERHFAQYGLTSIAAVIVLVVTVAEGNP